MNQHQANLVRPATAADAEAIARIYNYYVANTVITFEEEAVSAPDMAARIAETQSLSLPWLVAEVEGAIVGYAYARTMEAAKRLPVLREKPLSTWIAGTKAAASEPRSILRCCPCCESAAFMSPLAASPAE